MPLYEKALKESGFNELFEYTPADTSNIKHSKDNLKKKEKKDYLALSTVFSECNTKFWQIISSTDKETLP